MTEPDGLLARIDAEVERWERGPDAARWNPDGPTQQEQQDWLAAYFETYARLVGERWAEQWAAWGPILADVFERVTKQVTAAALAMQKLGFQLQLIPGARMCPHSAIYDACGFCYPPPFPAARDYRRRTRHRNRRRR